MSALGQKQTLRRVRLMSALPPKADMDQQGCDVRFVPKADIRSPSADVRFRLCYHFCYPTAYNETERDRTEGIGDRRFRPDFPA